MAQQKKTSESGNLALWERLARTDPHHTKQFTRAGGFKGTAIKPMWAIKRATEEFGPIGKGWGWCEDSHEFIHMDDGQVLIYIQARVWYLIDESHVWTGPQWGGDFAVRKNKHGIQPDDEAMKKALTDAVTKCLSYIGIGADVHMGQFDDQKYVAELTQEFSEDAEDPVDVMNRTLEDERVAEAVQAIKAGIADGDLDSAASAWFGTLEYEEKQALWIAPTKGGIFTTEERKAIKTTEFREAYYGKTEAA